jgi:hypothetical protein
MYWAAEDVPFTSRTTTLNEELGQVGNSPPPRGARRAGTAGARRAAASLVGVPPLRWACS